MVDSNRSASPLVSVDSTVARARPDDEPDEQGSIASPAKPNPAPWRQRRQGSTGCDPGRRNHRGQAQRRVSELDMLNQAVIPSAPAMVLAVRHLVSLAAIPPLGSDVGRPQLEHHLPSLSTWVEAAAP